MTYWTEYYKKNDSLIKSKQKERYHGMTKKAKKEMLAALKEKRANETDDEREDRLGRYRENYQINRDQRLEYQKNYSNKQKKYIKSLEKKIKYLQEHIS